MRSIFARVALASALGTSAMLATSAASALTYHVGPTQQYKQLSQVATLLKPGDIVEVDGNATYTGGVLFQVPGAAANKITIRGLTVSGKRPVIQGGTNTIEAQGDHYVFENLELTGGSFRCFYHHADDIALRGSVIHDCPAHGLLGADADSGSLLMEYDEVYKCGNGTTQHQIYMATDETAHKGSVFRMQYCYVHDGVGGNNVKSRAERNEIYYNWIDGALYHELELIGPDGQTESLAREDSDVVGNVIVKRKTSYVVRFGGDGTGQTWGRYRFVNNTVVTQPGGSAVFRLFDGIESVEMHNNVFTVMGSGGVNVLRTAEAVWSTGKELIAGTHNWTVTGSTNTPTEWTGTTSGADPGFVNLSTLDVHPSATSPLDDKGATTTSGPAGYAFPNPLSLPQKLPPLHVLIALDTAEARPSVGTIDIGAYEYGTTSSGGTGGTGGVGGAAGASAGGTAGTSAGGTAGTSAGGTAGTSAGGTAGTSAGGSTSGGTGGTAQGGSGGAQGGSGGTATGGKSGTGGTKATGGSSSGSSSGDDGGCGCRTSPKSTPLSLLAPIALFALLRRRRRSA